MQLHTNGISRRFGWLVVAGLLCAQVVSAKSTYVYVHDRTAGGGVYGFALDKRGMLSPLPGSPWALVDDGGECGGLCQTMAYSTKRKVLLTGGSNGVTAWVVAKDGTLSVAPGSPAQVPGGDVLGTGVIQIKKRVFVYSSAFDLDQVLAFELLADGQLTPLAPVALPAQSGPDGLQTRKKLVFVANESSGTVATFVAGTDGTLFEAPGSPYDIQAVGFVFNVGPDPKGKRLYISDEGDNQGGRIHAYSVDKKTAALTPITGSPFSTFPVGSKTGLAVAKKLLLTFDFQDGTNDIQPFKIGKKGALTPTGPVIDSGLEIQAHAIDAKGKRLIVAGKSLDNTESFVISSKVSKKDGTPDDIDVEVLPAGLAANAVVIVKR